MRQKILTFLGVGGCLSCYTAMSPVLFISLLGTLSISSVGVLGILTIYQQSFLFLAVFLVSLLFLLISVFPYGRTSLLLTLVGSIGVFASMTFVMQQWLFTISFALIAFAYYLSYRKTGNRQLKLGFVLLLFVVLIGTIDLGRVLLQKSSLKTIQPGNSMDSMTR